MVPFLDLHAQYETIRTDVDAAMASVIRRSAFVLGEDTERFEKAFAAHCGARFCVGVNNGTSAIFLMLKAAGIGPGDEVLVPTNSFIATAEGVSMTGAAPVFTDADPATGLIDLDSAARAVTPRTKAVMPVHLYGQLAPMEDVLAFAERRGIAVFEDACQAHGASRNGKRAGAWGRAAAFSFYPGKNLGAYGEGGAVVTDDAAIADMVAMLRDHGSRRKYHHELLGYNMRLEGIQAAVLGVKLAHLDGWNVRRRAVAAAYHAALAGISGLALPETLPGNEHNFHLYVVRTPRRDALAAALGARGIATGIHYPVPIHLQPAYAHLGKGAGSFPASEAAAATLLSLPMYAELTDAQRDEVVGGIRAFFSAAAG